MFGFSASTTLFANLAVSVISDAFNFELTINGVVVSIVVATVDLAS